jgi:DNA-binding NtrC family response regulator
MSRNRILFVSSDEENCKIIQVLLGLNQYEASFAPSVEEGVTLMKAAPVDLILFDWSSQDLDSFTLRQMIEALGSRAPVLLYTGVAYRSELEKVIGDGEHGYVVPPVDMTNILELITLYLKRAENQLVN